MIVGNGFGGVYTAKYLRKFVASNKADVTVIGNHNYFLFTPLLHEVATGGLTPTCIIEPLREIFRNDGIRVLQDDVRGVHLRDNYIESGVGRIMYDYLVLSTGASVNYRVVKGAMEYSFGLKDITQALALRNHIINVFERAETYERDLTELSFIVVGGGPTGVEIAGELEEFVCQTLASYYSWDENERTKIKLLTIIKQNKERVIVICAIVMVFIYGWHQWHMAGQFDSFLWESGGYGDMMLDAISRQHFYELAFMKLTMFGGFVFGSLLLLMNVFKKK